MWWTSSIWCFRAHHQHWSEAAKNSDRIKSNIFAVQLFTGIYFSLTASTLAEFPPLSIHVCGVFCFVWIPGTSHTPSGPLHRLGCWLYTHCMWITLSLSSFNSPAQTHTRTDRVINTSRGVLNVGFSRFSRCSLPGCRVTLASFTLQSGNKNVQHGSVVVPCPALGLPWLAAWPSECAFLMLPWPRWERWLVGLIVAAGPKGNRMERDGRGGVGVLFCWI